MSAIDGAARTAGRDPADVTLTAVCKQQPWERVAAVLAAGQRVFGENRVQEAEERWRDRRDGIELRLIGPLQTNKAREAVRLFDAVETLDRLRLARVLADEIAVAGVAPRLLVQVNTGEELQKSGVAPAEADAFVAACRIEFGLPIVGLMCIPPQDEPAGPHFVLLHKIAKSAERSQRALHGHERGFRARHSFRGDAGASRRGGLWTAAVARLGPPRVGAHAQGVSGPGDAH